VRAHKAKRITPPFQVFDGKVWKKQRVRIDCGIVDLVQAIWKRGIPTELSCENFNGDDVIQISVPNFMYADMLVYAACGPELEGILFWNLSVNSCGFVHCFFPVGQLPAILKRLTDVEPLAQAA